MVEEVKEDYLKLQALGETIDASTHNVMISAYGKNGLIDKAIETFESMATFNVKPDAASYNSLIAMYGI